MEDFRGSFSVETPSPSDEEETLRNKYYEHYGHWPHYKRTKAWLEAECAKFDEGVPHEPHVPAPKRLKLKAAESKTAVEKEPPKSKPRRPRTQKQQEAFKKAQLALQEKRRQDKEKREANRKPRGRPKKAAAVPDEIEEV